VAGPRRTPATQPEVGTGMNPPFLKRLLQACCRHQFSWPHTGVYGRDYQVCVLCGAAYEYDLATMRRTRRLASPEGSGGTRPLPGSQA
jgi:hypothetical protein